MRDARTISPAHRAKFQLAVCGAATCALTYLVETHYDGLNGPAYWQWAWQHVDTSRLLLLFIAALLPFGFAQWLQARTKAKLAGLLALLMLSNLLLQLAAQGVQTDPFSLARMAAVIESPHANGYLQAARRVLEEPDALYRYSEILSSLPMHPQTKPPGIALTFAAFVREFGWQAPTALVIGISLAVLATLSIPASYAAARRLWGAEVAFSAASLVALLPATSAFSPSFDAFYPVLGCAWVATWNRALEGGEARDSITFGILLAIGLFYSYSLLVLGIFLATMTLVWLVPDWRTRAPTAGLQAGTAAAACAAAYVLFYVITGFDPLATFAAATQNQERWLAVIPRPYPATVFFDLTDFAMGAAWIPLLPATVSLARGAQERDWNRVWFIGAVFLQLLVVAASGLLPGETIRVWLFLQPLLAMCAATELARWPVASRSGFFTCIAVLHAAIIQNMSFVVP